MARYGSWGKIDFRRIEEFGDELESLAKGKRDAFFSELARELSARVLALAIQRTPVSPGEGGGTLRRGWTGGEEVSPKQYAQSLPVERAGSTFIVRLANDVEYAIYKEYGHRTRQRRDGTRGFVEGEHMLEISMKEVDGKSRGVMEAKLKAWLEGVFD